MRVVCEFFERSGLSAFIGASYGTQQALQAMLNELIPARYLQRVPARSPHAEQRHRLQALSAQRLAPLKQPSHPIQALDAETRTHLEQVAGECADMFQRSSSYVEGRNGFLVLYHRLPAWPSPPQSTQAAVMTALHNFSITRPDGTTAAERFCAQPHPALFGQVLKRMPRPARPARRRPRPAKPPALAPVAALVTVDQAMIKTALYVILS